MTFQYPNKIIALLFNWLKLRIKNTNCYHLSWGNTSENVLCRLLCISLLRIGWSYHYSLHLHFTLSSLNRCGLFLPSDIQDNTHYAHTIHLDLRSFVITFVALLQVNYYRHCRYLLPFAPLPRRLYCYLVGYIYPTKKLGHYVKLIL